MCVDLRCYLAATCSVAKGSNKGIRGDFTYSASLFGLRQCVLLPRPSRTRSRAAHFGGLPRVLYAYPIAAAVGQPTHG